MRVFTNLALMVFPQETKDYICHDGIQVRYGSKFESNFVRVCDGIDLKVLMVEEKEEGEI